MSRQVIFQPQAEADLHQAFDWYEERATGLGREWIRCIDAAVFSVARSPERYPKILRISVGLLSAGFLLEFSTCLITKELLFWLFCTLGWIPHTGRKEPMIESSLPEKFRHEMLK